MKVKNNLPMQSVLINHFRILNMPQMYKVDYTKMSLFFNRIRRCETQLHSFNVINNPYTRLLHLFHLRGITDIKIGSAYHNFYFQEVRTINSSNIHYKVDLDAKYRKMLRELEKDIIHYYDEVKDDKISMDLNNEYLVYQKLVEYINYTYEKK